MVLPSNLCISQCDETMNIFNTSDVSGYDVTDDVIFACVGLLTDNSRSISIYVDRDIENGFTTQASLPS